MLVGDLAPTFSNTYPEILSPWVSEQDFRTLVQKLNDGLIKAVDPWSIRNWLDAFLGLATGWIWEDLGLTSARKGIRQVEQMLEDWNVQRRKAGSDGDDELVRVIGLRKTAYMTVSTGRSVAFRSWCLATRIRGGNCQWISLYTIQYRVRADTCSLQLDFQIPDPKIGGISSSAEQLVSRPETAHRPPIAEDVTASERPDRGS